VNIALFTGTSSDPVPAGRPYQWGERRPTKGIVEAGCGCVHVFGSAYRPCCFHWPFKKKV